METKEIEDFKNEVKQMGETATDAKKIAEATEQKQKDLEGKNTTLESELKKATDSIATLSRKINDLGIKGNEGGAEEVKNLGDAIVDLLKSKNFADNKEAHKTGMRAYEVKASMSNIVAPKTLTQDAGLQMERVANPSITSVFSVGTSESDKNTITYTEGKYSSNVGYVGEGTKNSTEDTVAVTETTIGYSKISAVIAETREMWEDASFVASQLQTQMGKKVANFLDAELLSGSGESNHLQGLIGVATEFDATKSGFKTKNPNLNSLMAAVKLQGLYIDATDDDYTNHGGYTIDTVVVSPIDFAIWSETKDKNGNYIMRTLADGSTVLNGLNVIQAKRMPQGELIALERGVANLVYKRNIEIKIGQQADDLTTDKQTMVAFLRVAAYVRGLDKFGIIYVDDIDAALVAITVPEPEPGTDTNTDDTDLQGA